MFKPKALSFELDTTGMSVNQIGRLYETMFVRKDYDWWYEVLPDDVVVDIGAGAGFFSAKALDAGAKKVYMIEPNRNLLKTAIKNVSDHIIDHSTQKVVPINAAIGKTDVDLSNVHKSAIIKESDVEPRLMTLSELVEYHKLSAIDFLKIDAAGAEYNILSKENMNFFSTQVRHIAVRCYLNAQYGGQEKFDRWRTDVLVTMIQANRANFQDERLKNVFLQPNYKELIGPLKEFMVYITNW